MLLWDRVKTWDDGEFYSQIGIHHEAFNNTLSKLKDKEEDRQKRGGPRYRLSLEDRLLLLLSFYKKYHTFKDVGLQYGVSAAAALCTVTDIDKLFLEDKSFQKALNPKTVHRKKYECLLVDSTETFRQRPRYNQHLYYSGKKKATTFKTQVVVDKLTKLVVAITTAPGKTADFALLKLSGLTFNKDTLVLADSGYQGLHKVHKNAKTPKKRTKYHELTKEEKEANQRLARERLTQEHVIGLLKRFNILKISYRGRGHTFGTRVKIVAYLYNLDKRLST